MSTPILIESGLTLMSWSWGGVTLRLDLRPESQCRDPWTSHDDATPTGTRVFNAGEPTKTVLACLLLGLQEISGNPDIRIYNRVLILFWLLVLFRTESTFLFCFVCVLLVTVGAVVVAAVVLFRVYFCFCFLSNTILIFYLYGL